MHYYKRHIGDYAKKAGHLSVLEHGVYTLLLDAYYDREQAPTRAEAVRIARCRSPEELAALDAVLSDFFHEVDGRYVQDRVEEEFQKAEAQARANQANGILGGRPRKPKGNPQETHSVSVGNPEVSEKNPNPLIHQSTNPISQQEHTPRKRGTPKVRKGPMPEGFGISDRVTAWAVSNGYSRLPEHLEAFKRKCAAKGYQYIDWDAALMEAIREDWAKLGTKPPSAPAGPAPSRVTGSAAALAPTESKLDRAIGYARQQAQLLDWTPDQLEAEIASARARYGN